MLRLLKNILRLCVKQTKAGEVVLSHPGVNGQTKVGISSVQQCLRAALKSFPIFQVVSGILSFHIHENDIAQSEAATSKDYVNFGCIVARFAS